MPNPSFEDLTDCPFELSQMNRVVDWLTFRNSPDCFNDCDLSQQVGVPYNIAGHQNAAEGSGYIGIHAYTLTGDFREYVGVQLEQPLSVGTEYYVSMKASATFWSTNSARLCNNKLGVVFLSRSFDSSDPLPILNYAHVFADSVITSDSAWTVINGTFVADSAYGYLALGNFFSDSETLGVVANQNGDTDMSYYYLDDICVSDDPSFCPGFVDVNESLKQTSGRIFPNPAIDEITISLNQTLENPTIEVLNVQGATVFQTVSVGTNSFVIPVKSLDAGLYTVRINDKRHIFTQRFLKQTLN